MGTLLSTIYDSTLALMLDDEWEGWEEIDIEKDLRMLLNAALPRFKFPRVSLAIDEDAQAFVEVLGNTEIQILAGYTKLEWLKRTILTWENIKPMYDERDFSQGSLLDSFKGMQQETKKDVVELENIYYRSINSKPYPYRNLAGK